MKTRAHTSAPPALAGFASLAEQYDGFICDLWGVLHDGVTAFPHALDCLERLKAQGKKVVILSNAPRRAAEVETRMNEMGIRPDLYQGVMSSGEEAWRHLKRRPDVWYQELGEACFHLGPDRDQGMRADLDYRFVESLPEADFLLNTGAHMSEDTLENYRHELEEAARYKLPMVCANPDLEVIRGGKREICAGLLAEEYERLGGEVRYHGKPHVEIYASCFAMLQGVDRARIAAVGDSLRTDIAGAQAAGVDGIFVVGGIHAEALGIEEGDLPSDHALNELYRDRGITPAVALPVFRW